MRYCFINVILTGKRECHDQRKQENMAYHLATLATVRKKIISKLTYHRVKFFSVKIV